jgi:hypothetical protein
MDTNEIRENLATSINQQEKEGENVEHLKSCETCIYWKRYMLKTFPNTEFLDDRFKCHEPNFFRNATAGEMNKKKASTDICPNWSYERK